MSVTVTIDTNPVKIQSLPEITNLLDTDAVVVDRDGAYTGRAFVSTLAERVRADTALSAYYADNVTVGLSPENAFYVRDSSISFAKLDPDLQDQLTNRYGSGTGSTLTGTISSFTKPLTATGDFLIVNVNNQFKAVRIWNFPQT